MSRDTEHWSEVLGVPREASKEDIDRAYRKKALEHHPDKGGSEEECKRITAAYEQATNGPIVWEDFADIFDHPPWDLLPTKPKHPSATEEVGEGKKLLKKARAEVTKAKAAGKKMLTAVIATGNYLRDAKKVLDHGLFMGYVEDETGLNHKTATRWMRIAEYAEVPEIADAIERGELDTMSKVVRDFEKRLEFKANELEPEEVEADLSPLSPLSPSASDKADKAEEDVVKDSNNIDEPAEDWSWDEPATPTWESTGDEPPTLGDVLKTIEAVVEGAKKTYAPVLAFHDRFGDSPIKAKAKEATGPEIWALMKALESIDKADKTDVGESLRGPLEGIRNARSLLETFIQPKDDDRQLWSLDDLLES